MKMDPVGEAALQYFGRTTASASHELKNALAIIRENAGLLNDYLLMAEKGRALEPERLKTIASRIDDQTRRADGVIKNMNQFAHSVDDPIKSIDLNETAALLALLSLREAAAHQVSLAFAPDRSDPVIITTAPFLLLSLLGRCLSFALKAAAPSQTLTLLASRCENGGRISFEQLPGLSGVADGSFPGENENALMSALDATFNADGAAGRITITVSNR